MGMRPRKAGGRHTAGVRAMSVVGWGLPSVIIILALTGGPARAQAQGLDEGKSGAKLFTTICVDCHRSPRGLAKDRFSWTLSYFLRQHYTSSSASAEALTAYLQSVDAPRAKPTPAARKSQPPATSASEPSLRPPAPVPAH
jgi:mono/diheme cytochrome c family protein